MKLNNDKFFKDFNNQYLLFVEDETKSISFIKRSIKNQIKKYLNMCIAILKFLKLMIFIK